MGGFFPTPCIPGHLDETPCVQCAHGYLDETKDKPEYRVNDPQLFILNSGLVLKSNLS